MEIIKNKPIIGILCWEAGSNPKGLAQLENLVGNSINPKSYSFPVLFYRVKGANIHTILENPSKKVLKDMIIAGEKMIEKGVKAITTSCGFNAIFQNELSDSLSVPVFTSSLLQVPLVQRIIGKKSKVCILTANKNALKIEHLASVGIEEIDRIVIHGLENCIQWRKIFESPKESMNLKIVCQEIIETAKNAIEKDNSIKAFVLECTDLPPFSNIIMKETGLPVFDFITMVKHVYLAIMGDINKKI